jgi:hypothetical protein
VLDAVPEVELVLGGDDLEAQMLLGHVLDCTQEEIQAAVWYLSLMESSTHNTRR